MIVVFIFTMDSIYVADIYVQNIWVGNCQKLEKLMESKNSANGNIGFGKIVRLKKVLENSFETFDNQCLLIFTHCFFLISSRVWKNGS